MRPGMQQLKEDIARIISEKKQIGPTLQKICDRVPKAFHKPNMVSARICLSGETFMSQNFTEYQWIKRQELDIPGHIEGVIEIFFSNNYLKYQKDDFFQEEAALLPIATLISGFVSSIMLEKLLRDNEEREKELKGIARATEVLKTGNSLENSLQAICTFLPEAWQYPRYTVARVVYDNLVFTSKNFKETRWAQKQSFDTPDDKTGSIEVFYLKEFPEADEGPFLKEERNLIDTLAGIISATVSTNNLKTLLQQNTERLKELKGINQTSLVLKQGKNLNESLQVLCTILPEAWQYPEYTVVRISFDNKQFTSVNFKETKWVQSQPFEAPGKKKGLIEVFYLKEFPEADDGPFLKEERNLLINLAGLIAGSASQQVFKKLVRDNKERLKELKAINSVSRIIARGKPVDNTLQEICSILPKSWQYPRYAAARVKYMGKEFVTKNFKETPWSQKENFITFDNKKGSIEVVYLKEFPRSYEGPFLKEERSLLINISKLTSGYINDYKGREIYRTKDLGAGQQTRPSAYRDSLVKNKRPLQLFFNQKAIDKYIYLDMMKYKVKEILFVSNLYDAFIIANEDNIFEQFMGEIYQYSLFSLPRITGVSSPTEAEELVSHSKFDLVILMGGIDREKPVELSAKIKSLQPSLPVYLLVNHNNNLKYFEEIIPSVPSIDKMFMWNGDSQVFFAIVKSLEDSANVDNDTKVGLVRVILLVEDSVQYYSKYLQILYSIVFAQVQKILPEVEKNELDKISKMRSRPKILLAKNYEDAVSIFNKYKDYLLCLISDVEFETSGQLDKDAGEKFIHYVRSQASNLPIILQSTDLKNQQLASLLGASFIHKNSETLTADFKKHLNYYLGFGDFVFTDKKGREIAVASTLQELESCLRTIPEESLMLHASANEFSIWLMARGEIKLAKQVNLCKASDFINPGELRDRLLEIIHNYKEQKKTGKIVPFDDHVKFDEKNIVVLDNGSLGGKGRGLAFINTLIYNLDFSRYSKQMNIAMPKTAIIGTDEFDKFLQSNKLLDLALNDDNSFAEIKRAFTKAKLSLSLRNKLKTFAHQVHNPIAIRSSSLSEDSLNQPFAGVFDTYIIPNNSSDKSLVIKNLEQAIKLVFASVYSDHAKQYFKVMHHKIEDEKMGVILQELVGKQHENYYYPTMSGTARSLNYYPVAHMKPEEGFAVLCVGLGAYIANGQNAYRFSPKYPKIELYTTKDLIKSSQKKFYAVDLSKHDLNMAEEGELASLKLMDITRAEKHGNLKHCASVYNPLNDKIEPGLASKGPRVINFDNILKYNYLPLSSLIEDILKTFSEAFGSPVEIEFAVELDKSKNGLPSFYLLQVRPLVMEQIIKPVKLENIPDDQVILKTRSSLGNGNIKTIQDVIFVDIEAFDKMDTMKMVNEIEYLNNLMHNENKQYILIGPGRWGTSDKFLGIPVNWAQISNAKVIVEISLANFPLDSSLGSHFFHNVSSMNIGYLSVQDSSREDFIRWEVLNKQQIVNQTNYFKHVCFATPLEIRMDGKNRVAAITR